MTAANLYGLLALLAGAGGLILLVKVYLGGKKSGETGQIYQDKKAEILTDAATGQDASILADLDAEAGKGHKERP